MQVNRDAIREAGCIPSLVAFLGEAESLEAKDKAVGALCNLAYMSPENKVAHQQDLLFLLFIIGSNRCIHVYILIFC